MAKATKRQPHVEYHRDGSVWAKGHRAGGVPVGDWEWFRKDGTLMRSGTFEKGVQVGKWTTYDKTGAAYKVTLMKPAPGAPGKKTEVPIRLVLVDPPAGVDYGIQRGRGAKYETVLVQRRKRREVSFDFALSVAPSRKDGRPNFLGDFAQGPPARRFVYVDVGTYAGQKDTPWARRMIVPLQGITWALIRKAANPGTRLSARIPGTAKDGGPNCATVQLLGGWKLVPDRAG